MNPPLRAWYRGKRVLVTGHTGFKGAWLSALLSDAGASVVGYALAPPPDRPSLFALAELEADMQSIIGDVRDRERLEDVMRATQPEIVFHLAAQSLVRPSYRDPVGTYATNVLGTVHLLDAARRTPSVRAIVVVTSDKCYENRGTHHAYREDEPMGGHDPYSSSKGCAELVTTAMRRSYFHDGTTAIASARAGNVIGGGDWSEDRLIPDLVQAAASGRVGRLRNPESIRPWQFVLEPLRGYMLLGRALADRGDEYAAAWNFGPRDTDAVRVRDVARRMTRGWDRLIVEDAPDADAPHEASVLALDCRKAREQLGWKPVLDLDDAVDLTVSWYREFHDDSRPARSLVHEQLHEYERRVDQAARQHVHDVPSSLGRPSDRAAT